MHHFYLWLFSIPLVSMVIIGLYQNLDEVSKSKFVLERRRNRQSDAAPAGTPRRRYSDGVAAGPQAGVPEMVQDRSVAPSRSA